MDEFRLADLEVYMFDTYGSIFPNIFPQRTTHNRYGDLMYENGMADELFGAWQAHLRFLKWERQRRMAQT